MKAAVIGSSGFLGSRIAAHYAGKWELFTPSHAEMDITNPDSVRRYMERVRPDVIIQCAAVSDTGACQREPERSRRINVEGSVHVARIGGSLGAKCILCSSDQVYFGSPGPHSEDENVHPVNEYGRQKLEMERRCLAENPDVVLLRLSWMYDVESREGEHGNFMQTLLAGLAAGDTLAFPVYDKRGITNVSEVVENLDRAMALPGGVYNFGAGNDASTFETMQRVFARVSPGVLSRLRENTGAFADDPRDLCMDGGKAGAAGIRFSSTEDGLAGALEKVLK